MIVCHCHALTDRDIRAAAGACGGCPQTVQALCGAGTACGGCTPSVERIARTCGHAHTQRSEPSERVSS